MKVTWATARFGPQLKRRLYSNGSDVYMPVHPKNAIQDNLEESQHIGAVDPTTVKAKQAEDLTEREKMRRAALKNLPPVGAMLSLDDFERAAKSILTDQAWAYYCSAGDDEISASLEADSGVVVLLC